MTKLSTEGLLTQLGYNPNESIVSNIKQIISKTPGFEEIQRHIIALNHKLKPYGAFIAISNSKDYLKIKIEKRSEFLENEIEAWARKYKIGLLKEQNQYYITGKIG